MLHLHLIPHKLPLHFIPHVLLLHFIPHMLSLHFIPHLLSHHFIPHMLSLHFISHMLFFTLYTAYAVPTNMFSLHFILHMLSFTLYYLAVQINQTHFFNRRQQTSQYAFSTFYAKSVFYTLFTTLAFSTLYNICFL